MDGPYEDQNARATGKFSTLDCSTSTVDQYPKAATLENLCRNPTKFFSNDFFAVALFSGVGLVISLIAMICGEQGSWL
jgi:hypothetical protein